LHKSGVLDSLWSLPYRCHLLNLPEDIWMKYWDGLKTLIPDGEVRYFKSSSGGLTAEFLVGPRRGDKPPLQPLAERRDEWFKLMQDTAERIRQELNDR
jgi:hypothetical protein